MDLSEVSAGLQKIHGQFNWINAGGCGEFANMLGSKFKQSNLKYKYVLIINNRFCGRTTRESLRKFKELGDTVNDKGVRNGNGFDIAHIMVYHKGIYFDSTGAHKNLEYTNWGKDRGYNVGAILSQEILETWCNQDTWNDLFNREQIPFMQNCVSKLDFSSLNKVN
jgi:hypothetical protein